MEELVTSGWIAGIVLAALALEVTVVSVILWRRSRPLDMLSFVATILAGGSLVLALRSAILGAGWLFVAMYLAAALLAHAADLALRLIATRHAPGVPADDKTKSC